MNPACKWLLLMSPTIINITPVSFYFWITNTGQQLKTNTGQLIIFNPG